MFPGKIPWLSWPLFPHCCCSITKWCLTFCNPTDYSAPGFPVLYYLLKFAQTHVHELVMLSNHLILCCPLLLLPSIFPSIRVFSNESAVSIMRSKYWSFSFSICPSKEYSRLISFKMDWFDLAAQGTLMSLFQHHSSKVSFFQCSDFFMVHLSRLCITTRNTNYVYISCSVMSDSLQPHGL